MINTRNIYPLSKICLGVYFYDNGMEIEIY